MLREHNRLIPSQKISRKENENLNQHRPTRTQDKQVKTQTNIIQIFKNKKQKRAKIFQMRKPN